MRVRLSETAVVLSHNEPIAIHLEVTNDLEVIDGISALVLAEPGLDWTAEPAQLALFPEASGRITIELTVAPTFPAGSYRIPIRLRSAVAGGEGSVEMLRPSRSHHGLAPRSAVDPLVRTGRRRVNYSVRVANAGNTPLEMVLAVSDPNRAVPASFTPSVISVDPGAAATTTMTASSRRHWFGGELSHQLSVLGTAGSLEVETKAVFRQHPVIPRGARTATILATIVILWAAIFAVVLSHALGGDPLTKQVPASFYASVSKSVDRTAVQSLGGASAGLVAADGTAPAGAVPKSGVVIGVGGTISGTVSAASTQLGIGRINVQAFQQLPGGPAAAASAATATDGTYSIPGLLPGDYKVEFEAPGFQSIWYPAASTASGATTVTVDALGQTSNINTVISGLPGSISGIIATGESPSPPVTVTVQPEQGATQPLATVTSKPDGSYLISNLPTPGQYDLSFSSSSYQVASATDSLTGGEALIANTVTLSAAAGSISGTVSAGGHPLGGVSITAQADGQTFTSATPTSGTVGRFSLADLPSPATYLLTFTASGYGTRSIGENLGPGENLASLDVTMQGGAGDISGTVSSAAGTPLGGVQVTIDGGAQSVSTETLTAGTVGAYTLSALATPATYTLTFSLAGYASQTIAVPLASSGAASDVDVKLSPNLGSITGTVTSSATGAGLTGVSVSATDGSKVTTTTSTSQPAGGFLLSGLAPGNYSVTFSFTGYSQQTYLVTLAPGGTSTLSVGLGS